MLDETFEKHANEQEKAEIAQMDQESTKIQVPVHLAINQSIKTGVFMQSKLVNKCLLHMMYRKLNLM